LSYGFGFGEFPAAIGWLACTLAVRNCFVDSAVGLCWRVQESIEKEKEFLREC